MTGGETDVPPPTALRTGAGIRGTLGIRAYVAALLVVAGALYAVNLHDDFLSDDYDLIHSFYGKPPVYFLQLLVDNESGDVWRSFGIGSEFGRGYLRPIKIWLLKLDFTLWHTNSFGFHLTSTLFFMATVVAVFFIEGLLLPGKPWMAFLAAAVTAAHPVFSEIVPFITAREDLVATCFALWAIHALLRHHRCGASAMPFYVFYALALLTKETAIAIAAFAVGYDLVHGRLWPKGRDGIDRLVRFYGPVSLLLGVYLSMRWVAFGNFKGGTFDTQYLSADAAVLFHARLWNMLLHPTMFSAGGAPIARWTAVLLVVLAVALVIARWKALPGMRRRDLGFVGPVWYLCSTAILYGAYFSVRHQILPVVGLILCGTLLLDSLSVLLRLKRERWVALGALALSAGLLVPPTVRTSLDYHEASRTVGRIRRIIEERARGVPDGGVILLEGVPQWMTPPWYFGWGLLSSLMRPFSEDALANRVVVIDRDYLVLNHLPLVMPERFDLVLQFPTAEWVSPGMEMRRRARAARDGYSPRAQ